MVGLRRPAAATHGHRVDGLTAPETCARRAPSVGTWAGRAHNGRTDTARSWPCSSPTTLVTCSHRPALGDCAIAKLLSALEHGAYMQDGSVLTAVVIHGIVALACVVGGVFALFKGHNVYRDRAQDGHAKVLIEMPWLKISAQSLGGIVMATAFGWAALGVHVVPDIKASPEHAEVYSFVTGKGIVDAPVVYAAVTPGLRKLAGLNPTHGLDLVDAFTQGAASRNAAMPAIGGKPAKVKNVHPVTTDGKTFLLATFESNDSATAVLYDPTLLSAKGKKDKVVFKPLSVLALAK